MNDLWKSAWSLVLLLSPFVIALTGVAIDLHIAGSRHFRVMEKALQRSPALDFYINLWGTHSLRSRGLVVAWMSGLLLYPSYSIKKGALHADDVRDFPRFLERRMRIASWLTGSGMLGLLVIYTLLKLTKE
ncbi:hypothetical protein BGP80_03910 [Pseudomonas putida]|uniref:Uncharacterized protein n=1 Tax=Pseudomonas putida TaxID=303 RepID=A0A2S3W897_PSEPU|nr:hypothetical protein BGP80_03910 [Pseudomonas putida]